MEFQVCGVSCTQRQPIGPGGKVGEYTCCRKINVNLVMSLLINEVLQRSYRFQASTENCKTLLYMSIQIYLYLKLNLRLSCPLEDYIKDLCASDTAKYNATFIAYF